MTEPRVGRVHYALGYAGLLPQMAAVTAQGFTRDSGFAIVALAYGALILSFLGGIWWGSAVGRTGKQAGLLFLAITPSLIAFALILLALFSLSVAWPLVLLGSAILLTLLVDRRLVATGEAPGNWMRLRVPLSLGLGLLTIAAGVLAAF